MTHPVNGVLWLSSGATSLGERYICTHAFPYIYIHYKLGQFSCKSIKLEVGKIQHKQGNYTKTEKGIGNDLVIVSSLDEKLAYIYFYG